MYCSDRDAFNKLIGAQLNASEGPLDGEQS